MFKPRRKKGKRSEVIVEDVIEQEEEKNNESFTESHLVDESIKSSRSVELSQDGKHHSTIDVNEERLQRSKPAGRFGPIHTGSNVKISTRIDYQPDLCKDYNETGYCGYGDTCKFLHDRGDYKSGLMIEKEWESVQSRKRKAAFGLTEFEGEEKDQSNTKEGDALPFACYICRKDFVRPVRTKCRHYFCEDCALKRYSKNTKCSVCGEQTKGIFNTAHEIVREQKRKKEMLEEVP